MKTNILKLFLCLGLFLNIITFDVQAQVTVVNDSLIDYNGLIVKHRFSTPLTMLDTSVSSEEKYSKVETESYTLAGLTPPPPPPLGTEEVDDYPSIEEVVSTSDEIIYNFPFNFDENSDDELDIDMIKADFPDLTDEILDQKEGQIMEYYYSNLEYLTLKLIKDRETVSEPFPTVAPLATPDLFGYTGEEIDKSWLIYKKLRKRGYKSIFIAYALKKAKKADELSIQKYGNHDVVAYDNTYKDAYRHLLLISLAGKYYKTWLNIDRKIKFALEFGEVNEEVGENPIDTREMDEHNNTIGAELLRNLTSYKYKRIFWKDRKVGINTPDEATLITAAENLVNAGFYMEKSVWFDKLNYPDEDIRIAKTQAWIEQVNPSKVVYFVKPQLGPNKDYCSVGAYDAFLCANPCNLKSYIFGTVECTEPCSPHNPNYTVGDCTEDIIYPPYDDPAGDPDNYSDGSDPDEDLFNGFDDMWSPTDLGGYNEL